MPKITRMERQKHKNTRVSVFVDDEYSFSLSDEAVIEYGLTVGKDVNTLPLEEIYIEDQYRQALSSAFNHMSRSEKSEKQLSDFLYKKEFSQKTVNRVIARLKELNYLDDFVFARNFIENSKNAGVNAIKMKLKMRGISDAIINEALQDISEDDQLSRAMELAQKQLPKYAKYETYDQKRKINDFLYRKGFQWDVIKSAVERIFSEDE